MQNTDLSDRATRLKLIAEMAHENMTLTDRDGVPPLIYADTMRWGLLRLAEIREICSRIDAPAEKQAAATVKPAKAILTA